MQIRLIFSISDPLFTDDRSVLLYGDFFSFEGPSDGGTITPIKGIDMYMLRRHYRSDRSPMSDVIALNKVLEVVQLVPRFGEKMNAWWNSDTSLAMATEFWLNNFANKNTFHAVLSYQ